MMKTLMTDPSVSRELQTDGMTVWSTCLDDPIWQLRELAEKLSPDEKARAGRFHFERDARRFTVCRAILRMILGGYLGLHPEGLQFCYGGSGKPVLRESNGTVAIHFNVSHSHGMALHAFALRNEIGVDVEYARHLPEMEEIAQRFFSAGETANLISLPPGERQEAFFRCWTRKEALLKAMGDGLGVPLDRIDVSPTSDGPIRIRGPAGASRAEAQWTLYDLKPAPNYVATVAVEGEIGACRLRLGTCESLVCAYGSDESRG